MPLERARFQANNRPTDGMLPFRDKRRLDMTWENPAFCEIRLGFEVTAYVYVR